MLSEGFHVHRVDGDHYNKDPENLILIEAVGHAKDPPRQISNRARYERAKKALQRLGECNSTGRE